MVLANMSCPALKGVGYTSRGSLRLERLTWVGVSVLHTLWVVDMGN